LRVEADSLLSAGFIQLPVISNTAIIAYGKRECKRKQLRRLKKFYKKIETEQTVYWTIRSTYDMGEVRKLRRAKEITVSLWVKMDGKYVLLDSLPADKQREILVKLNDRAMRASGYVPADEGKKPTA